MRLLGLVYLYSWCGIGVLRGVRAAVARNNYRAIYCSEENVGTLL